MSVLSSRLARGVLLRRGGEPSEAEQDVGHEDCGCEDAQAGVRHAIAEMAVSRRRLAAAIQRLKQVDEDARMTGTTATTAQPGPVLSRTTDVTLLQAAVEQAGRHNAVQAEMIDEQRAALIMAAEDLVVVRNQLADWQQRYQSAADRLAENWPPNEEVARLRKWCGELQSLLSAALSEAAADRAEAKAARLDANRWHDKYLDAYKSGDPNYSEGAVEAPAALPAAKPTDEEMLG